ncbi:uncharacterized protein LOC143288126 isoform X1 [Babylonia areolata]|uniref:uncharacterized protein LOC143288126 isoform X1 n=1 Tax=Babylonia areolata TaxID=304850 RepID=UPI003FD659DE
MKVVLQVLTVMSLISLTKGSGCNPFLYENITVHETTVADTELLLMEMEAGEGLEIEYQSYRIANSKLRDYYRGALRLIPTYNNNPDKCQAQAGVTHCKLVLAKPLDAEVIFQLAGNNSKALQAKFTLSCTIPRSRKSRTVTLMVCPVDEFDPEFSDTLRNVSVTEENGTDWIRLDGTKVVLTKEIRFEELVQSRQTRLWFKLSAQDSEGRVGKGLMIVQIEDVDNHPPYFSSLGCQRLQPQNCSHPFYTVDVPDDFTGDVDSIRPAQILAEDGDIMLNATIRYSFLES